MAEALRWLQSAPASAISAISAVLAATVALTVLILTQWILGRRARSDLLTKKLEEFYLLITQWRDEIEASDFAAENFFDDQLASDAAARKKFAAEVRRPLLDRRVSMYIHFYFPQLLHLEKEAIKFNRDNARLLRRLSTGQQVTHDELHQVAVQLATHLSKMQGEIQDNHAFFVRNTLIKPRYKRAPRSGR